jgi:TetR/AcrR family transcriptional repressor of nem operon
MNETAERLMDSAEAHMRNGGYGAFSFRDIAAEVGISSASVHHHFPTKPIMAAAVARRYGERFLANVAQRADGTPEDVVAIYRAQIRGSLERHGQMCLCGVLGVESGSLLPEVADEIEHFFRRCIEDITRRLGGGPAAEKRAHQVMATLEGAMMLARVCRSVESFDLATADLVKS